MVLRASVELTKKDFNEVCKIIKAGGVGRQFPRALVLKMKHLNYSNIETAEVAGITPRTVINICQSYQKAGLFVALNDDPRPGQPVQFDDRIKSRIIAIVCSQPPEAFDRWTLELLQERVISDKIVSSISKEKLRIILHEHDIKPWQHSMWCVPDLNKGFIEKMEDVLEVYERPLDDSRPVICIDEKPVQLLSDVREGQLVKEGRGRRVDYEYKRKGVVNVFMGLEPKRGVFQARVTENRTGREFAKYLSFIERKYSKAKSIDLVMDNLNTHRQESLINLYGAKKGMRIWKRFEVHYTPSHGSWLNQAEIAIGMYSRQCLGHSRISDIKDLRKKTKAWERIINRKNIIIQWKFNKKDARQKFKYNYRE